MEADNCAGLLEVACLEGAAGFGRSGKGGFEATFDGCCLGGPFGGGGLSYGFAFCALLAPAGFASPPPLPGFEEDDLLDSLVAATGFLCGGGACLVALSTSLALPVWDASEGALWGSLARA